MTTKTYTVITVPGIGEAASTTPKGMLANLTAGLPDRFVCSQFSWQNRYGPAGGRPDAPSYARNKALAVTDLTNTVNDQLRKHARPVILVGYSGGAHVASEALVRLGWQGRTSTDLPAAVLVANPVRGVWDGTWTGRYGIAGQHGTFPLGMKLIDVANPVDVICSCPPPPHPLRGFADLTERFSLSDQIDWGRDLLDRAQTGRWQNAWRLPSVPSWFDAVALARGYAFDGQHTTWYVPRLAQTGRYLAGLL